MTDRVSGRFLCRDDRQRDRGADEGRGKDPGHFAQSRRGCAARRDGTATTAAAHAKAAPFGALHQHDANQAKGQKKVDDKDDVFHGTRRRF